MADAFWANVRTHLRFFSRNRILVAVGLVFAGFLALSLLMTSIMSTVGGRFGTLKMLLSQLTGLIRFFAPSLGLVLIWSHLRERCLKMVFTKPCAPEVWLLSGLGTAAGISAGLHALALALIAILGFSFGVPFQSGFVFLALESFVSSIISLSYVSFLTTLLHPVLVLLVLALSNEDTLQTLLYVAEIGARSHPGSVVYSLFVYAARGIWWVPPMLHPFHGRYSSVVGSLRTGPDDWLALGAAAGYAILAAALFFLLIDLALRRKNLS